MKGEFGISYKYKQPVTQVIAKRINMLMILCMMTGITVIFCNMIGQIINEHIDPRVKANETIELSEVTNP